MLRVIWGDEFHDLIPMEVFVPDERSNEIKHIVAGPKSERLLATCDIKNFENQSLLNYEAFVDENNMAGINSGKMKVFFKDSTRREVIDILWKDPNESKYNNHGCTFKVDSSDYRALEGHQKLVTYKQLYRDNGLSAAKKLDVLSRRNYLTCEACHIDLRHAYGKLASSAYEVHHRHPISEGLRVTSLEQLAILCANCHQAIHALSEAQTIEALRDLISESRRDNEKLLTNPPH